MQAKHDSYPFIRLNGYGTVPVVALQLKLDPLVGLYKAVE